jgi:uncharacterized protein (DUF4213/DUF364 family)
MKIIDELIQNFDFSNNLKEIFIGLYTTYVENEIQAGLSSTLYFSSLANNLNTSNHKHFYIKDAGNLKNKTGKELCEYINSDTILEASIGMAAINSYVNAQLDIKKTKHLNAAKLILEKGENKNIGVIGHFPFIDNLKKSAKNLYVFELFPKCETDLGPDEYEKFLPECDVVAITGTTLLNHTLENVMQYIKPKSFKIMLGPSTPMSEILLDYGFNALCGSYVENKQATINHITQAVSFKQIAGISHLTLI